MTQLVDGLAVMLCIALLLMFLARDAAGTISVGHRRPWLRQVDAEARESLNG